MVVGIFIRKYERACWLILLGGRWGVVSFTVFSLGGCYWETETKTKEGNLKRKEEFEMG